MSEPIHQFDILIADAEDVSSDFTSEGVPVAETVTFCVHASFTGSPVGSIKLQASNDPDLLGWGDITDSIQAISAAGSYILNYDSPGFSHVRLVYTFTSGTGVLNAKINGKRR